MLDKLNYREFGILMHIFLTGKQATEPSLRTPFSEGRDALRASLRRLESMGYITRKKTAVGSTYGYDARLTDRAIEALKTRLPMGLEIRQLLQLSELTNTSYITSLTSKEYTGTEPRENELEENMSDWGGLFEASSSSVDEKLEARAAAQKERKAKYTQEKEKAQKDRLIRRQDISKANWSVSDIGYEFADRIQQVWGIKPWSVRQSRFIPALSEFRKKYDTDGEIEFILLELFFSSIDLNKFDNAEILWRMFIKRAPEYVSQARGMVRTDEQIELAKEEAKRTQSWLYE